MSRVFTSQISQLTVTSWTHPPVTPLCASRGSHRHWFQFPCPGAESALPADHGAGDACPPQAPASAAHLPRLQEDRCRHGAAWLSPRSPRPPWRSQRSACTTASGLAGRALLPTGLSVQAHTCRAACPQTSHDASPYSPALSKRRLLTAPSILPAPLTPGRKGQYQRAEQALPNSETFLLSS